MSYQLSFTPDFFYSEEEYGNLEIAENEHPTNCMDALIHLFKYRRKEFEEMLSELSYFHELDFIQVHGIMPECLMHELLDLVKEVNTCSNLNSPVEVWLDPEGYNTIKVYDE